MAIKPPAWCSRAVPTLHGWKHWATAEILIPRKFTQEMIDEFWAEKNGTTVTVTPVDPVVTATDDFTGEITVTVTDDEEPDLDSMSKVELEALGREKGVELDRRKTKRKLVEELKKIYMS